MNLLVRAGALVALSCSSMLAADSGATIGQIHDRELSTLERELVPLAEAMPADKYDFAPTQGAFNGVRTFGQQMAHVASVMYSISATVLGEKPPADIGTGENGPDSLKGKDAIVKYLKDAFSIVTRRCNRSPSRISPKWFRRTEAKHPADKLRANWYGTASIITDKPSCTFA